jgi:hypothetical protein
MTNTNCFWTGYDTRKPSLTDKARHAENEVMLYNVLYRLRCGEPTVISWEKWHELKRNHDRETARLYPKEEKEDEK